jgi:hypothetical protein
MKQPATFVGWDFATVWASAADLNGGYPYLQALGALLALPAKATNPSPADGATEQPVDVALSWQGGAGTMDCDVYLDTANPPSARVATGVGETVYAPPSTLSYGTTYFWRVDEKNTIGTTTGDVWSFSTSPTTGTPVLAVALSSSVVAAGGDSVSLDVSNAGAGTMNWTAEVTNGGDWLTIASGASGTDAGTVAISAAANTGAARTGTITLRASSSAGPVADNPRRVTIGQMAGGDLGKGGFAGRQIKSSHSEKWDPRTACVVGKDSYSFSAKMQLPAASLATIDNTVTLTVELGDTDTPGAAYAVFVCPLAYATKSTLAGHPAARNPKAPTLGGAVSFVEMQPGSTKVARTVTMKWNKSGELTLTVKGTPAPAAWGPAGGHVVDNAADLCNGAAWPAGPVAWVNIPVVVRLQDVFAGTDSIVCAGKKTVKPSGGGNLAGWSLSGK